MHRLTPGGVERAVRAHEGNVGNLPRERTAGFLGEAMDSAGLWATIDAKYAQATNFLEGHTIDLQFQSFRITDSQKKAIDANYLVTDLKFST